MSCGRLFLVAYVPPYYMLIMFPLLGLHSRSNPHLQLIALVILNLSNPKIRYDIGFSLGAFTKINVCFVTPFWVLLSGVNGTHLQLLALVIPNSGNTKVRCDISVSLDTFYINKINVTFATPFGSTVKGKGNPKSASIGHSVLGNKKVRYDTDFSIAFYIHTCQFCYPILLPLFWLRSGVKPSLSYLNWSVRTRRSLMYAMSVILTLVLLHKLMNNNFVTPFLPILRLLSGVKQNFKCLYWSLYIRRTL